MPRTVISTTAAPQPRAAYSQAISTGALVFTAGFGSHDPQTGEVRGDDIRSQTRYTLDNVAAALEAAGLGLGSIVKVTAHLADLVRDFSGFNEVYRDYLSAPYPVRTTVGSTLMGILVEIDVVAVTDAPAGDEAPQS